PYRKTREGNTGSATNGQSPRPIRLMNSDADSSATSNSCPPTMRSKISRPDFSVMQLRVNPAGTTSPSRIASIRSSRQQAKVRARRDMAHLWPNPSRVGVFIHIGRRAHVDAADGAIATDAIPPPGRANQPLLFPVFRRVSGLALQL